MQQFLMEQFLIQQILQSCVALVQHSVFNFKRVADLDFFNSGYIYLSSLGKFSSFVFIKCFSTFLSLLVSIVTPWYSSKLLLTFYLALLAFLISYFLLTQANCAVSKLNILPCIFPLILKFMRQYTHFQEHLKSVMCFYGFLLCKILQILQCSQYTKIYKTIKNVGIVSFYRICLLAPKITMKLLNLTILCRGENFSSLL